MNRPSASFRFPWSPPDQPSPLINVGRLPPHAKPELDYRTTPHLPEHEDNIARVILLLGCLAAAAVAFMMHLEPFARFTFGQPGLILATGKLGIWAGLLLFLTGRVSFKAAAGVMLFGYGVGLMLYVLYWAIGRPLVLLFLALPLTVLAVGFWVDQVLFHRAMWMNAQLFLPRATRQHRARWYQKRWSLYFKAGLGQPPMERIPGPDGEAPSAALVQLRREEYTALGAAWAGGLLVLGAYVFCSLLPHQLLCATATLVVPPVLAFFYLRAVHPAADFRSLVRVTWEAVTSFLTYEREPVPAAGAFHSPVGLCHYRIALTLGALFFVAATLPALTHFFPITYELYPWSWRGKTRTVTNPNRQQSVPNWTLPPEQQAPLAPADEPIAVGPAEEEVKTDIEAAFKQRGSAEWYVLATYHMDEFSFVAAVLVGLAATCLLPALVLGVTALAGAGPFLLRADQAMEAPGAPEQRANLTLWEAGVTRIQESQCPEERRHLWLGRSIWKDYPILLDPVALRDHAYLVGDTGSGKTSLGIIPVLRQLMRQRDPEDPAKFAAAVVVLDLKADPYLFQSVRAEAQALGRPFQWFTNELGLSSYVFNPLRDAKGGDVSINQLAERYLDALNLNHGEGFARSFYSRIARRQFTALLREHPLIQSFEELYQLVEQLRLTHPKAYEQVLELVAVLESLSHYHNLNMRPGGRHHDPVVLENAIRFDAVVEDRQVIYFSLPAALESMTVREIGKLAIYSLLAASYRHARNHAQPAHTYLVVDEFQRLASEGLKVCMEQMRGFGVSILLSNQTFADLRTPSTDLRQTVLGNTRYQQVFSARDPAHQEMLMKTSGSSPRDKFWWMLGLGLNSVQPIPEGMVSVGSVNAVAGSSRITQNQLLTINDDPAASIVHVSRGSGFSAFGGFSLPISGSHVVSAAQYEALKAAPWPADNGHTITLGPEDEPPSPELLQAKRARGARIVGEDVTGPPPGESPFDLSAAPKPPEPRPRGRPRKSRGESSPAAGEDGTGQAP